MTKTKTVAQWGFKRVKATSKVSDVPTNVGGVVPDSYPVVPREWYEILPTLGFVEGVTTKSEIARKTGKSEGAVRKAVKAIQQAIPLDALERGKKLTELAEFLAIKMFERPETMAALEWVEELKNCIGALPDPQIWVAVDTSTVSDSARRKAQESTALARQNEDDLDALLDKYISYVDAEEEEEEADLDLEFQRSYKAEQRRLANKFRAKVAARADFDKKFQARGL